VTKMGHRHYQPEIDGESPCVRCPHDTPAGCECIAAGALCTVRGRKSGPELRKWWLTHVRGVRVPETDIMIAGREAHERIQREAGVTRDLGEVFDAMSRVGESATWTARLCSRYLGIRGEPDVIRTQRLTPDKIRHLVTEIKGSPNARRSYFFQVIAYALMLSYRQLTTNGIQFYDELPLDRSFSVDVDFQFRYYRQPDYKQPAQPLIRDWKFVGNRGFIWGLKRTRRKFSGLLNVKQVSEIERCAYCPSMDSKASTLNGGKTQPSELCYFWSHCRDDLLAPRSKQLKLGRWVRRPPRRLPKTPVF